MKKKILFVLFVPLLLIGFSLRSNLLAQEDAGPTPDEREQQDGELTEFRQRLLADEARQAAPAAGAVATTPCVDGMAGPYPCNNVDLIVHIPPEDMNATGGNDSWGWTDPLDGKEYALMGLNNGTAFIDISDPENIVYLGKLPTHTSTSLWRDIKVYANHAFIVSEAGGHGMQVFDLTELRTVTNPPVTFSNTAHYSGFGDAHNIVINEDSGFAYAVGADCSGGLHMINISNPTSPLFAGCFSEDGYTHDAQCVNYIGPDPDHQGSEICMNANADTLTIVDVTNKAAPVQLSRTGYDGVGYAHQGWFTEDQAYFLLDDESDEIIFGHNTRTYIWDVADLDNPTLSGIYEADVTASDHNLYTKGNYVYEANYRSGLRILDISDVANANLEEVAYFDTYPDNDNASQTAAWSTYPYFDSGLVIISDMNSGFFLVKPKLPAFSILPEPSDLEVCQGTDALYTINVIENGATDPVTLSAGNVPAGGTAVFSDNPVTPTGTSVLSVTTGGVAPGSYALDVVGMNVTDTVTGTVDLTVSTGVPGAPSFMTPADGAVDVDVLPTFEWSGDGIWYILEVADDIGFSNVIYTATVAGSNHESQIVLEPTTTYYWRVTGANSCGTGPTSAEFSFTTRAVSPILLVDDDDNAPDLRVRYTTALVGLGWEYDVWDTGASDDEPPLEVLLPYTAVIWFTGGQAGSFTGPGDSGEAALAGWLDAGQHCLFLSSQDYHYARGLTSFMQNYLGVASVVDDDGNYTSVNGQGTVFGGLGPYTLTYITGVGDYSDIVTADGSAEIAMEGNNLNAGAVNKDGGSYKTTFWGFPWEVIINAGDRQESLQTFLDWCPFVFPGVTISPDQTAPAMPGESVTYTVAVTNTGNFTDSYNINLSGFLWPTVATTSTVTLGVAESVAFEVTVTVPLTATAGQEDTVTVTAVSQTDVGVSAGSNLTTLLPLEDVAVGSSNSSQSGDPGETLTYTVWVSNTGNVPNSYDLSLSGNSWGSSLSTSNISLPANSSGTVLVVVTVPSSAPAYDSDSVTLLAAAGSVTDSVSLVSTANAVYEVDWNAGNTALTGEAGTTLTYTLALTNSGNITDTFTTSTSTSSGWAVTTSPPAVTLISGETAVVAVVVEIPTAAGVDDSESITLTVTSAGDGGVTAVVELTATVVESPSGGWSMYLPVITRN